MAREISDSAHPSPLTSRTALGLLVILAGIVWVVAAPSLAWFGYTPVGLYRTLNQPPILLVLVGVWYTLRARRRHETVPTDEAEDAQGRDQ
jgi:hypothetical protein